MVHPIRQGAAWPGRQRGSGPAGAGSPGTRGSAGRPGDGKAQPDSNRQPGSGRPGSQPAGRREPAGRAGQRKPAGGGQRAGAPGQGGAPAGRPQVRLTGRGALVGMFALFFVGLLISGWLSWMWLAGLVFLAGSGAAARYTNRRDLLAVAVSPPLIFLCALILTRALTASGSLLVSVAEGSLLTLASVAPWLFAGVAVNLIIGMFRGLASSVRELRRDLRSAKQGLPERARPAAQSRRPTPQ